MKITIIGGGSYQWGPELISDLCNMGSLHGAELVLEDIDPAPLPKMARLAEAIDAHHGSRMAVSTTTDQRQALDGADYVVVTISTGGFRSMSVDLDVPEHHGFRQSVGDSVGPGGVNRSLRNVPVLVGIGKDMEEVCPDAWLLNITNPMTVLTRSVCKETSVKTVGLCHEVGNFCLDLAIALRLPGDKIRPTVTGVNHFPVVTELEIDGQDGFEVLRSLVEECGGLDALAPVAGREEAESMSRRDFAERHFLKLSLLERWGVFPCSGDRHVAEFVPWILTEESGWGASWNVELTSIATRQRHQDEFVAHVDAMLDGSETLQTWPSGELPAIVIDSLVTGEPRELPVNIPNTGQCPDLPLDAVVESICVVDGSGIRGRDQATAPPAVAELLRRHVAAQELTLQAALSGDRAIAREAFSLDPLAGRGDLRELDTMVDQLLEGTATWLPQFAQATGQTGVPAGGAR